MDTAIRTKILYATNRCGARVKAECGKRSITIPYPHELSGEALHRAAVDALNDKIIRRYLKWGINVEPEKCWRKAWRYVSAQFRDGEWFHVYLDEKDQKEVKNEKVRS